MLVTVSVVEERALPVVAGGLNPIWDLRSPLGPSRGFGKVEVGARGTYKAILIHKLLV